MKKLKNFYLIKFFLIILFFSTTSLLFAKKLLINDQLIEITKELRCMTCQNQTIYESNSEFSNNIKIEILKQLNNGKTKKEIINFMIDRYGEYIVFKPLFNAKNLFLWIFPFVILIISIFILFFKVRKN